MAANETQTMQVEIVSIRLDAQLVNQNGQPYVGCEVIYKNNKGDILDKKMHNNTFKFNGDLFEQLKTVKPGDHIEVVSVKKGAFVNWQSVTKVAAPAPTPEPVAAKQLANEPAKAIPTQQQVRSNYETPEERATKQVYIVRQSSLTAALKLAELQQATGNEYLPDEATIIESAKLFEDYVFGRDAEQVKLPE